MSKLNSLFKEVIEEMWNIKNGLSDIAIDDLLEFGSEYFNHQNLVWDLLNHLTISEIQEKKNSKFGIQNEVQLISFFKSFNGNHYNRLIVDTLLWLKTPISAKYLMNIIHNSVENKQQFEEDFDSYLRNFDNDFDELLRLAKEV